MGKLGVVVSTIYVLVAIYVLNNAFSLFTMPGFMTSIEGILDIAIGILLVIGAYTFWKYDNSY